VGWLAAVDWSGLFVPTYSLLEIFLRGTLTYLALFAVLRFLLKRQAGAIGIADLLVVVLIADAAQNAFGREYSSVTEGVLLVLTIVFWDYALDWLEFRFPALRSLTRPKSLVLVRGGRVLRRNLRRELMTEEELRAELRKAGIDGPGRVSEARIEGDGQISILRRDGKRPRGGKAKKQKPPGG
jgi:uncharacterized membrane protein YcaP (DUF421 family)